MIITICSSVSFTPKILELATELESQGHTVNIPYFTQMIKDGKLTFEEFLEIRKAGDISLREEHDVDFFMRYWNYIVESDAVLVLNEEKNGIAGYVGGNTLMEMGFSYVNNKPLYLYNPIPERSERMHYVDELLDLKPIVIHGDLSRITD